MTHFQLYAIEDAGPRALAVPDDATQLIDLYRGLPLGVYDALRTFEHNKFLYLNRHLARTERSMALLGWTYRLDRARLLRALHGVVTAAPWPEMRVRFDVLAGPAEARGATGRELIALQPFTPPPAELYETGVAVALARGLAREQPLAKTADFAARRPATGWERPPMADGRPTQEEPEATARGSGEGASFLEPGTWPLEPSSAVSGRPSAVVAPYEYLLLDSAGRILEGTGTNFWAVREGVVYTAGEGVLEGITREILLQLIAELGIPLRLEAVGAADVATLDEAALSGSSRALLPVVNIAGQTVGDGRPGAIIRRVLAAYNAFVAENVRVAI
jgi:branched-chain amino acid aminotransferase